MSLSKMKIFSSNACLNVCCRTSISYSVCRFKIQRRCVLSSHPVKGIFSYFLAFSPQSLHLSASHRTLKIHSLAHRERDPVPSQEAFSHCCQSIHPRCSSLFSPSTLLFFFFSISLCHSSLLQHSPSFSSPPFLPFLFSPSLRSRRSHEPPLPRIHVASLPFLPASLHSWLRDSLPTVLASLHLPASFAQIGVNAVSLLPLIHCRSQCDYTQPIFSNDLSYPSPSHTSITQASPHSRSKPCSHNPKSISLPFYHYGTVQPTERIRIGDLSYDSSTRRRPAFFALVCIPVHTTHA